MGSPRTALIFCLNIILMHGFEINMVYRNIRINENFFLLKINLNQILNIFYTNLIDRLFIRVYSNNRPLVDYFNEDD